MSSSMAEYSTKSALGGSLPTTGAFASPSVPVAVLPMSCKLASISSGRERQQPMIQGERTQMNAKEQSLDSYNK